MHVNFLAVSAHNFLSYIVAQKAVNCKKKIHVPKKMMKIAVWSGNNAGEGNYFCFIY